MDDQSIINRLERMIATAEDEAIHCNEASDIIMQCEAAQLSEAEMAQTYPLLAQHLLICPDCQMEYQGMMNMMRWEAAGNELPDSVVPPRPIATNPMSRFLQKVTDTLEVMFTGFPLQGVTPVVRSGKRGQVKKYKSVKLTLEAEDIRVDLSLRVTQQKERFELRAMIIPKAKADLEGLLVDLEMADAHRLVDQVESSKYGDVTFANLSSGKYTMRWQMEKREFVVTQIEIPAITD